MQPVEDFLNDYFRMRGEFSRASSGKQAEYMDRFVGMGYGTSHWVMEQGDTETIASVRESEDATEVITKCSRRVEKSEHTWRGRYRIARAGESWEIVSIERECFICDGTGTFSGSDCEVCKGKGWSSD